MQVLHLTCQFCERDFTYERTASVVPKFCGKPCRDANEHRKRQLAREAIRHERQEPIDADGKTYPNAYVLKVYAVATDEGYRSQIYLGPFVLWQSDTFEQDKHKAVAAARTHMVYAMSRLLFIATEK